MAQALTAPASPPPQTLVSAGSPILLTLLARPLLHEPIPLLWPLHLSLCIAGCLMVAFPSSPAPAECPRSPALLLPAAAALCAAATGLLTRTVREVPPPLVLLSTDLCALFIGGSAAALYAVFNGAARVLCWGCRARREGKAGGELSSREGWAAVLDGARRGGRGRPLRQGRAGGKMSLWVCFWLFF